MKVHCFTFYPEIPVFLNKNHIINPIFFFQYRRNFPLPTQPQKSEHMDSCLTIITRIKTVSENKRRSSSNWHGALALFSPQVNTLKYWELYGKKHYRIRIKEEQKSKKSSSPRITDLWLIPSHGAQALPASKYGLGAAPIAIIPGKSIWQLRRLRLLIENKKPAVQVFPSLIVLFLFVLVNNWVGFIVFSSNLHTRSV